MYGNNTTSVLDHILSAPNSYQDKARVKYEVEALVRQMPSLQPKSGPFTQNNGFVSVILNLSGTIPIFYHGSQYNIPVEIWLPKRYPLEPPVSYVRPTQDMMIKPGHMNVDRDGLITLPYIANWNPNTHTLVELIAHQCSAFGAHPPVFRKPAEQPVPTQYGRMQNQYQGQYQQSASQSSSNTYQSPQQDPRRKLIHETTLLLQQQLRITYKNIREDMDAQFELQMELSTAGDAIQRGIADMNSLSQELEKTNSLITQKDEELSGWLEHQESAQGNYDVDNILVCSDIWSQQMVDAFSESLAIDDALYYMDRALANGSIDLNVFLKEVRKLSARQFMSVALTNKIRELQAQTFGGSHYGRRE